MCIQYEWWSSAWRFLVQFAVVLLTELTGETSGRNSGLKPRRRRFVFRTCVGFTTLGRKRLIILSRSALFARKYASAKCHKTTGAFLLSSLHQQMPHAQRVENKELRDFSKGHSGLLVVLPTLQLIPSYHYGINTLQRPGP